MRRCLSALLLLTLPALADVTVGFPESMTPRTMAERYAPEIRQFERILREPVNFVTYDIGDQVSARRIAENGLIAATPAAVASMLDLGLTPVGYHGGEAPILLVGNAATDTGCTRVGQLGRGSIMGLMAPYLIDKSGLESVCVTQYSTISNLVRAMNLDEVDAGVIGGRSTGKLTNPFTELARGTTPLFAFFADQQHERFADMFVALEADRALAPGGPSGRPILAWDVEAATRYRKLQQDLDH